MTMTRTLFVPTGYEYLNFQVWKFLFLFFKVKQHEEVNVWSL